MEIEIENVASSSSLVLYKPVFETINGQVGGSVTGPSLARAYHPQDFNKYPKQLISTGSRVSSRAGRNFLGYVKKVNVGGVYIEISGLCRVSTICVCPVFARVTLLKALALATSRYPITKASSRTSIGIIRRDTLEINNKDEDEDEDEDEEDDDKARIR
uniref:Uncharacterized protein n=1 Tax=Vespula pensylvanica TaxID=30213 RepID=A0A834KZM0_VESPE|nr:hypothetical protein H0235_012982 [Vespula pensylvanica]